MFIAGDKEGCCGCGACISACTHKCITMVADEEGFEYPQIDEKHCVGCGLCKKVCPILNYRYPEEAKADCFAAFSKNSFVRMNSSSGGVFTELATHIVNNGGVVCGAMFDESFNLKHDFADSPEGINMLRGSKYIQSKTAQAFAKIKEFLDEGITVMFSGTPCQIEGLLSYLNRTYENLITQDIICHGVPSDKLWKAYCKNINKSDITAVSFRDKKYGWRNYSYSIDFNDKSRYYKMHNDDAYSKLFLKNMSLRPSCYECVFKGEKSRADLTLGDFWGVDKVLPRFDYKAGVSLVIVNSVKGEALFSAVNNRLCCERVDLEKAFRFNNAKLRSASRPEGRSIFYKDLNDKGFDSVKKIYLKESIVVRIKRLLKNTLKKILK